MARARSTRMDNHDAPDDIVALPRYAMPACWAQVPPLSSGIS